MQKLAPKTSPVPLLNFPQPKALLEFPKKERDLYEEMLAFIELFYQRHRRLPKPPDFEAVFPKAHLPQDIGDWQDVLQEISPLLEARGIKPYVVPDEYMEPNFILAVSLITNPTDTRSRPAKLKEAGLTPKLWKNLLLKPRYKEYFEACLNEIFDEHTQNAAKLSLMQLVENGDIQGLKLYLEWKNIYRPSAAQHNDQILIILKAIMEVLAVHVSGDVLIKIGAAIRENPVIEATLKELPENA